MITKFLLLLAIGLLSAHVFGSLQELDSSEPDLSEYHDESDEVDQVSGEKCGEDMYFSQQSGECEYCSSCKEFMYIRKECSATSNTQCGWCGSRIIVKNDDFNRKCKHFSMYHEFRQKLIDEFKAKHPLEYSSDEDPEMEKLVEEPKRNKKIVVTLDKWSQVGEDDEDKQDLILADEEDFMNKRVYNRNAIKFQESKELTSNEIDTEIEAKEVDEQELGMKDAETQTEDLENEVLVEEVKNDDINTRRVALKEKLEKEMIKEQLADGNYKTIAEEDGVEGEVIEVRPPDNFDVDSEEVKTMEKTVESLDRADEIEFLPLRIVVTGDVKELKALPRSKPEDNSEESSEESREESSEEDQAASYEEDPRAKSTRRMIRIALMSITFVVMCWIMLSYREKRRRRVFIIPPLDQFSAEQNHMINRCTCKANGKDAHCYENKMAYV